MRRARYLLLGGALFFLACGEVFQLSEPMRDGGSDEDASADGSVSEDASTDTTPSPDADVPTCDASLATDNANCGACGRVCEQGTCTDGGCDPAVVVANYTAVAAKNDPIQFLERNGQLYIVDSNTLGTLAGVLRCPEPAPKTTCTAARIVVRPSINAIALQPTSLVYVARAEPAFEGFDGGVGVAALDGGDASVKDDIVIDARSVALMNDTVLVATATGLARCMTTCKALSPVAGSAASHVVADANGYCFSGMLGTVSGVHCSPSLAAPPTTRVDVATNPPPRLALVGNEIVWLESGKIGSTKRDGSGTPVVLQLGSSSVSATDPLVADGAYVTWAHQDAILRCPRAACTEPVTLAKTQPPLAFVGIAQNEKWLYFGEGGGIDARVLRLPR